MQSFAVIAVVNEPDGVIRAVIGGARHIHLEDAVRVTRRRPDVQVVGVIGDERHARRWAQRFGAPAFDDWGALLRTEPDAALVYSKTSAHERYVEAAATAGLAVFVEKPLAAGAMAARRIATHLDARAQVGFFLRYCPAIRNLLGLVRSDALGTVVSVTARFVHDGWAAGWFDGDYGWMAAAEEGGGGFFDLAVHCMDLLEFVGGPVLHVERADLRAAHHGTAQVHLDSGAIGRIEAGWQGDALTAQLDVSGDNRHARVLGGRLFIDGELTFEGPPPSAEHALDVFFDRLGGQSALPRVDPAAAVRSCEMTEELRQSASRAR